MGAPEIAQALGASRRAVRLYPPEHPSHREAVTDLVSAVESSIDIRPLALNLTNGRLYEGSEILSEATPGMRSLAEAMEARRVESLTFHAGFADVDAVGLSEVLGMRPSPELQVQAELEARGVTAATVSELEDNLTREAEERDRRRESDRSMYRASLAVLKQFTASLVEGESADVKIALRAIGPLIERVAEDRDAILALARMTGHGGRTGFHAVSVMLHSLVLGQTIGMSDKQLFALGLAGLMHDIGFALPSAGEGEPARLAHAELGARALGAVSDEDCAAMIVAYEHHMGADGSGWPERPEGYATHPFTRIVAVADRYDNLTRPEHGDGLRPDGAIAKMLEEATGGPLDPVATRLFATAVGVLPIGSVVRVSDTSIGVVRAPGPDPMRPQLRIVLDASGCELKPAADLDLVEDEDERWIVDVLPAELLGIEPSDHL